MDRHRSILVASVLATVSSVYPGFLMGALSVQISDEFDVSEKIYGWGLGGFFLAATAASALAGRLGQRIGPRRQLTLSLMMVAAAQGFIAIAARSFGWLLAALCLCGVGNAATQTAVNLALTRARVKRLGLAIAFKQSGMPTASLLGGLAVPLLALTVGWRWAFGMGTVLALGAVLAVFGAIEPEAPVRSTPVQFARSPTRAPETTVSATTDLLIAAAAGSFLAFGAGSLNAWVVASGVDAGLGEGTAGLTLSLGAGCGIALRLLSGFRLDRLTMAPFRVAGTTVLVGAAGVLGLTGRSPTGHVVATVVAFAGGWVWPVFTNYGIVRTNPVAAGSATGLTQTGVYIGVFSAPLVTGWLIERVGYSTMWAAVAGAIVVGAGLTLSVARRF